MEALLSFLSGLAPLVQLSVIVAALIVFRKSIIKQLGWQTDEEKQADIEREVPSWAQELLLHFNHDTTKQWDDVGNDVKEMHSKQDRVVRLLEEIKEYGIICRKPNDKV